MQLTVLPSITEYIAGDRLVHIEHVVRTKGDSVGEQNSLIHLSDRTSGWIDAIYPAVVMQVQVVRTNLIVGRKTLDLHPGIG